MASASQMTAEGRKALARDFLEQVWDSSALKTYPAEVAQAMRTAPLAYFRGYIDAMKVVHPFEVAGGMAVMSAVGLALHGDAEALQLLVQPLRTRLLFNTVRLICFLLPVRGEDPSEAGLWVGPSADWIEHHKGRILFDSLAWCYRAAEASPDARPEPVGSGRMG